MEQIRYKTESETNKVNTHWNEILKKLEKTTDKLGHPIDNGIKETVAAFIANEFPTYGSCEGHIEKRFGKLIKLSPYIAVRAENKPKERFINELEIKQKIAQKYNVLPDSIEESDTLTDKFFDYININKIPETKEFIDFREKNLELERKINEILNDFKQKNETKINIKHVDAYHALRITTEAERKPIEINEEEKEERTRELLLEQEEMKKLGIFLKGKFFEKK